MQILNDIQIGKTVIVETESDCSLLQAIAIKNLSEEKKILILINKTYDFLESCRSLKVSFKNIYLNTIHGFASYILKKTITNDEDLIRIKIKKIKHDYDFISLSCLEDLSLIQIQFLRKLFHCQCLLFYDPKQALTTKFAIAVELGLYRYPLFYSNYNNADENVLKIITSLKTIDKIYLQNNKIVLEEEEECKLIQKMTIENLISIYKSYPNPKEMLTQCNDLFNQLKQICSNEITSVILCFGVIIKFFGDEYEASKEFMELCFKYEFMAVFGTWKLLKY